MPLPPGQKGHHHGDIVFTAVGMFLGFGSVHCLVGAAKNPIFLLPHQGSHRFVARKLGADRKRWIQGADLRADRLGAGGGDAILELLPAVSADAAGCLQFVAGLRGALGRRAGTYLSG